MEYIRVRQNTEVKTNQHDLKKIINPLDLGSKAKMKGSARHSTSPLQLGTLLNFCLLVAACIIISCTVKVNFYKSHYFSLVTHKFDKYCKSETMSCIGLNCIEKSFFVKNLL